MGNVLSNCPNETIEFSKINLENISQSCEVICPSGQYNNNTICVDCSAGTYQDLSGQKSCKSCEIGKYQNLTGQIYCNVCPSNGITLSTGSTSISDCKNKIFVYSGWLTNYINFSSYLGTSLNSTFINSRINLSTINTAGISNLVASKIPNVNIWIAMHGNPPPNNYNLFYCVNPNKTPVTWTSSFVTNYGGFEGNDFDNNDLLDCSNSHFLYGGGLGNLFYSSDGINWALRSKLNIDKIMFVKYINNMWVIAGVPNIRTQNKSIWYCQSSNPTGNNWGISNSNFSTSCKSIDFGGNKYVAIGTHNNLPATFYSSDCITWIQLLIYGSNPYTSNPRKIIHISSISRWFIISSSSIFHQSTSNINSNITATGWIQLGLGYLTGTNSITPITNIKHGIDDYNNIFIILINNTKNFCYIVEYDPTITNISSSNKRTLSFPISTMEFGLV